METATLFTVNKEEVEIVDPLYLHLHGDVTRYGQSSYIVGNSKYPIRRHYKDRKNGITEEHLIAFDKETEKLLNLEWDMIKRLQYLNLDLNDKLLESNKDIENHIQERLISDTVICRIKIAKWTTRLKWLFTGVIL